MNQIHKVTNQNSFCCSRKEREKGMLVGVLLVSIVCVLRANAAEGINVHEAVKKAGADEGWTSVLPAQEGIVLGPSRPSTGEGVDRLNEYLASSRSAQTMGIEKGEIRNGAPVHSSAEKSRIANPPLSDIGKCVPFTLDMHTWGDNDMIAARVNWGQIQNLFARCGNEYSEDWCASVVAHIKNSVGYRELEMAVLHFGRRHETASRDNYRRQEDGGDADENKENVDTTNSFAAYSRAVRKYLEREKRERNGGHHRHQV